MEYFIAASRVFSYFFFPQDIIVLQTVLRGADC